MNADEIVAHLTNNTHELDAQWARLLRKISRADMMWPDVVEDIWRLLQEERALAERDYCHDCGAPTPCRCAEGR